MKPYVKGREVYAQTAFKFLDRSYLPGDVVDMSAISPRKIRQLWDMRRFSHEQLRTETPVKRARVTSAAGAVVSALGGGWHTVVFGGRSERVRGRAKADALALQMAGQ